MISNFICMGFDSTPNSKFGLKIDTFAPDFKMLGTDGEEFHLKTALNKQPVLLNFFRGHF
jgi:peroxiredoxin